MHNFPAQHCQGIWCSIHFGRQYADWRDATSRCWEPQLMVSQQIAICSSYMAQVVWLLSLCTRFPTPILWRSGISTSYQILHTWWRLSGMVGPARRENYGWVLSTYTCWIHFSASSYLLPVWWKGDQLEAPGDLYRRNRGDTGLVLVPKLKYEHVHLTSFSKMWVD